MVCAFPQKDVAYIFLSPFFLLCFYSRLHLCAFFFFFFLPQEKSGQFILFSPIKAHRLLLQRIAHWLNFRDLLAVIPENVT